MYINESIKMIFKSVILDLQEATEAQEFFSRLDNKTKKSIGSNLWKRPFIWTFFRQNKPKANISSKYIILWWPIWNFFKLENGEVYVKKVFIRLLKYPAFSLVRQKSCFTEITWNWCRWKIDPFFPLCRKILKMGGVAGVQYVPNKNFKQTYYAQAVFEKTLHFSK